LELSHLARDDEQHGVGFAGHPVGRDHLRHRTDGLREAPVRGFAVALEGDGHVDLKRESGLGGIEPGGDAADDARFLEAPDAVQRGGGG
jgi:hypothetical protein